MTVLTIVLSRPARMIVNNTPSKTSTPLCLEESTFERFFTQRLQRIQRNCRGRRHVCIAVAKHCGHGVAYARLNPVVGALQRLAIIVFMSSVKFANAVGRPAMRHR